MSEVPDHIRTDVVTELYRQAAELDWELLPISAKKLQYRRWVEDPRVGGRLRAFWDDHRIGTWIKDTPMKEYARVQEGFGPMAKYAASRYVPEPEPLVRAALGDRWAVKRGSLDEKPMHCVAVSGQAERYVCWGKPASFRDLTWAALDKAIEMPIRPMIIVTPQDENVLSVAERRFQQAIAEHCGIDICYLPRRVQRIPLSTRNRVRCLSTCCLAGRVGLDEFPDAFGGSIGVFVFPDADDLPASLVETGVCVGVAGDVALDLGSPEVRVLLSWAVMFWATVPEATVQEDGHLGAGEDDVSGAADLRHGAQADAVAQAKRVQGGPKREFGLGVSTLVASHDRADCGG